MFKGVEWVVSEIRMVGFDYLNNTEQQEIKRNLEMLYTTAEGTCPGDRAFGLDMSFQCYPAAAARNLIALEIMEKTEIYEPRAEVINISFLASEDGCLRPQITVGPRETAEDEDGED